MVQYPMKRIGITAGFGPYTVNGVRKPHNGCDICSQSDTSIVAAHSGKVVFSFFDSAGGNMLAIIGEFNSKLDILTRYAHLASRAVGAGQRVEIGQKIGVQGATGSACFGQHLHFETWLVPKGYNYNYADRAKYSVDPLSVCHLVLGQNFIKDGDTGYLDGIPYPEPITNKLKKLNDDAKLRILDSGLRLRQVPFTCFTPLVGNSSDRSRDTLGEWISEKELSVLYSCETTTNGKTDQWVMIDSKLGQWWVAIIDGMTELLNDTQGGAQEDENVDLADIKSALADFKVRLTELEASMIKREKLVLDTVAIWQEVLKI